MKFGIETPSKLSRTIIIIIIIGYRNEIWYRIMRKGKRQIMEGTELQNQERIRMF